MTDNTTVLVAPVMTEKSMATSGKYTFKVHADASKGAIKKAINEFYGVDVEQVNIVAIKAKTRVVGRGRTMTKRANGKKAVVTLKSGQTLNFNDFK